MIGTLSQWIRLLDRLAPPRLAEAWDAVGLQVGHRNRPIKKVWTALDPLPEVVAAACESQVDLLVVHHPLFFKPIQRIDCESPLGQTVELALTRRLAIYCAHTNLDSVAGGVNDLLAGRLGLGQVRVLSRAADADMSKLVVFVPVDHVQAILDTLFELGAGRMGNYSCCSFRCPGVGTFLPDLTASPALGERGMLNEVQESRIEILVANRDLEGVVAALKKAHPYEAMAYDVYPLAIGDPTSGLGRVGQLPQPLALKAVAATLKAALSISTVKVAGNPEMPVERVAVCSGSGNALLTAAIASGAQVYVSGDLGYHAARDAQQAGMGLIDVGHFASEHLVVEALAASIRSAVAAAGLSAVVEAADMERDPFHYR